MSWIQTATRLRFDLAAPDPALVNILDIAHALSHVCRFGGHTTRFYSVAQHSVLVSRQCEPRLALVGLLHDAAEAYMGDIVRPMKRLMPAAVCELEAGIMAAVFHRFDLNPSEADLSAVKFADDRVLATEARDLMDGDLDGWAQQLPKPLAERIVPHAIPQMAALEFKLEFSGIVYGPSILSRLKREVDAFIEISGVGMKAYGQASAVPVPCSPCRDLAGAGNILPPGTRLNVADPLYPAGQSGPFDPHGKSDFESLYNQG